jgi:phospholipase C
VVEIMLENHSFDNLFGHFPNANGIPQGTELPNPDTNYEGALVAPRLAPANVGDTVDINHNRAPEVMMMHNGEMNYYTVYPDNGLAAITEFDQSNIPNEWALARNFALAEDNFQPATGPTQPNREYAIAGTAGGWISDSPPSFTFRFSTIYQDLAAHGRSWGIFQGDYVSRNDAQNGLGFVRHWNTLWYTPIYQHRTQWDAHVHNLSAFLADAKDGTLPSFSFVVPTWLYSEHPPVEIALGDAWVGQLVTALMHSPNWPHTAIFITYDEGGGYWDHVSPPQNYRYGFGTRTPMVMISPWVKTGLDDQLTSNVSILAFMEHLWGLPPLTARDAQANDLLSIFTTHHPRFTPVSLPVVPDDTIEITNKPQESQTSTVGQPTILTLEAKTAALTTDSTFNGAVQIEVIGPKGAPEPQGWPQMVTLHNGRASLAMTFKASGYYQILAQSVAPAPTVWGGATIDVDVTPDTVLNNQVQRWGAALTFTGWKASDPSSWTHGPQPTPRGPTPAQGFAHLLSPGE